MKAWSGISKTLAVGALALGGVTAATATAQAQPAEHGCPAGDNCIYNSQTAYNAGKPSQALKVTAVYLGFPVTIVDTDVNNTDPQYTSEGNFVLQIPGVLCVYVPDTSDEQAPGTTEDHADGASVDAMASGNTAAQADAIAVVALSDCRGLSGGHASGRGV
jgi:hypothetical protein